MILGRFLASTASGTTPHAGLPLHADAHSHTSTRARDETSERAPLLLDGLPSDNAAGESDSDTGSDSMSASDAPTLVDEPALKKRADADQQPGLRPHCHDRRPHRHHHRGRHHHHHPRGPDHGHRGRSMHRTLPPGRAYFSRVYVPYSDGDSDGDAGVQLEEHGDAALGSKAERERAWGREDEEDALDYDYRHARRAAVRARRRRRALLAVGLALLAGAALFLHYLPTLMLSPPLERFHSRPHPFGAPLSAGMGADALSREARPKDPGHGHQHGPSPGDHGHRPHEHGPQRHGPYGPHGPPPGGHCGAPGECGHGGHEPHHGPPGGPRRGGPPCGPGGRWWHVRPGPPLGNHPPPPPPPPAIKECHALPAGSDVNVTLALRPHGELAVDPALAAASIAVLRSAPLLALSAPHGPEEHTMLSVRVARRRPAAVLDALPVLHVCVRSGPAGEESVGLYDESMRAVPAAGNDGLLQILSVELHLPEGFPLARVALRMAPPRAHPHPR